MLLHALVWNALHPNMHALPEVPWRVGAPSSVLAWARSTWYFRYLYQNHEGHHVLAGQANYNVACPGTDHLVGTYKKRAFWRPKAVTNYADYHGMDVSFEQQIANAAAREKFGIEAAPFVVRGAKAATTETARAGDKLVAKVDCDKGECVAEVCDEGVCITADIREDLEGSPIEILAAAKEAAGSAEGVAREGALA